MIFSQDRNQLRQMYADAWEKHLGGKPMTPLEMQIAETIALHPEYHEAIREADIDAEYSPDSGQANPFLHLGLHLGLREQLATNRPAGIAGIFRQLAEQTGDGHDAEHRMIECLAEALWESQRHNRPPDEERYLESLRRLLRASAG
ncbi:MAG: DUF1841 family protein [Woeseiaceae bacterium]|nr:DUF1841 family protein [Woeseiaceae bacterium]